MWVVGGRGGGERGRELGGGEDAGVEVNVDGDGEGVHSDSRDVFAYLGPDNHLQ